MRRIIRCASGCAVTTRIVLLAMSPIHESCRVAVRDVRPLWPVSEVEQVLDLEATAKNVDPKNGKNRGKVLKDITVDATGGFEFTLDPALTGDVKNGIEFIHKMANSEVVEQVFIRHAFRYWLGRNETLGRCPIAPTCSSRVSGKTGKHNALLVSLLPATRFCIEFLRISKRPPKRPKTPSRSKRHLFVSETVAFFSRETSYVDPVAAMS